MQKSQKVSPPLNYTLVLVCNELCVQTMQEKIARGSLVDIGVEAFYINAIAKHNIEGVGQRISECSTTVMD